MYNLIKIYYKYDEKKMAYVIDTVSIKKIENLECNELGKIINKSINGKLVSEIYLENSKTDEFYFVVMFTKMIGDNYQECIIDGLTTYDEAIDKMNMYIKNGALVRPMYKYGIRKYTSNYGMLKCVEQYGFDNSAKI